MEFSDQNQQKKSGVGMLELIQLSLELDGVSSSEQHSVLITSCRAQM
jgi:hypothetical protein